jgi:hypothetical protein
LTIEVNLFSERMNRLEITNNGYKIYIYMVVINYP